MASRFLGPGEPDPALTTIVSSGTPSPSPNESIVIPTAGVSPEPTLSPTHTAEPSKTPVTPSYPEDEQNWIDNVTQPEIRWELGNGPEPFGLVPDVEQDPDLPVYGGIVLDAVKLADGNVIIIIGMEDAGGNRFFVPFRAAHPEGLISVNTVHNSERVEGQTDFDRMAPSEFYDRFGEFKNAVTYFSQWASAGNIAYPDNPLYVARKSQEKPARELFSFATRVLTETYLSLPRDQVPKFINTIPDTYEDIPILGSFNMYRAPDR